MKIFKQINETSSSLVGDTANKKEAEVNNTRDDTSHELKVCYIKVKSANLFLKKG